MYASPAVSSFAALRLNGRLQTQAAQTLQDCYAINQAQHKCCQKRSTAAALISEAAVPHWRCRFSCAAAAAAHCRPWPLDAALCRWRRCRRLWRWRGCHLLRQVQLQQLASCSAQLPAAAGLPQLASGLRRDFWLSAAAGLAAGRAPAVARQSTGPSLCLL